MREQTPFWGLFFQRGCGGGYCPPVPAHTRQLNTLVAMATTGCDQSASEWSFIYKT